MVKTIKNTSNSKISILFLLVYVLYVEKIWTFCKTGFNLFFYFKFLNITIFLMPEISIIHFLIYVHVEKRFFVDYEYKYVFFNRSLLIESIYKDSLTCNKKVALIVGVKDCHEPCEMISGASWFVEWPQSLWHPVLICIFVSNKKYLAFTSTKSIFSYNLNVIKWFLMIHNNFI